MSQRVVIIQGSKSDNDYTNQIVSTIEPYGIPITRRIASAHRTPLHLQKILDQYDNEEKTVFITVAGLSDALSGTVAARYPGRVIACPPDYDKYGEMKKFSSTCTPKGIEVKFAKNPQEATGLVKQVFDTFDFSKVEEVKQQATTKRDETIMDDIRLQSVDEPLPYMLLKKGKTRDVYDLGDETLAIRASDRVSAFDVILPEKIPGKGMSLTDLSEYWFKLTKDIFPNHFIERIDERTIRVKKAKRIDIEWVVRGYLYGSLARAYGKGERFLYGINFPDGLVLAQELPRPILTATTKSDTGHDEPITKELAIERDLVKHRPEWEMLERATFDLFEFYKKHAKERGVIIPDFKLEFGTVNGGYIHLQIDEPPTHDSARFWAEKYYQLGKNQESHALDKEFLRQFLISTGYSGDGEPPHLPELVIDQVSRRCAAASQVLKGIELEIAKFGLKSVEEVMEELKR